MGPPRRSYDVILIFQDGDHTVANLLPALGLVTAVVIEGRNLFAHQLSMRYFNPRLRYYYFRFLKTSRHHIGILLPVSILIYLSSSTCIFHQPTKFHRNRSTHDGVMTSYQDGGRQCTCNCRFQLGLPISI